MVKKTAFFSCLLRRLIIILAKQTTGFVIMTKLILINQNEPERRNALISHFYDDLNPLMRIRGFQFFKHFDESGHLVALDWFSFARKQTLFTLQFNRPHLPVPDQILPHLEQILNELSIFQLVDVFLFDELGIIEPFVEQIRQQIITVFSSKHTVIAVASQQRIDEIDYLNSLPFIRRQPIIRQNDEQLYVDLIGELYDH